MPVDRAAQIVVRMQRLAIARKAMALVARLKPEQAIHRRRPMHVAAREVPAPDAATGQRLGQLIGEPTVFARVELRRPRYQSAAAEQSQQKARAEPAA